MMDEGGGGQSLGGAKSVLFVVMEGDGFGFFVDSIMHKVSAPKQMQ